MNSETRLDNLREIAETAAATAAQKEAAAETAREALRSYVDTTLAVTAELANLRQSFLDVAGPDVEALSALLEDEGVELDPIRTHWLGTSRSAIDKQPETRLGSYDAALAAVTAPAFREQAARADAAARAQRAEQRALAGVERQRKAEALKKALAEDARRAAESRERQRAEEAEYARAEAKRLRGFVA